MERPGVCGDDAHLDACDAAETFYCARENGTPLDKEHPASSAYRHPSSKALRDEGSQNCAEESGVGHCIALEETSGLVCHPECPLKT